MGCIVLFLGVPFRSQEWHHQPWPAGIATVTQQHPPYGAILHHLTNTAGSQNSGVVDTTRPLRNNIPNVRISIHYYLNIQVVEAFSVDVVLLMLCGGLDTNMRAVNNTHNSRETAIPEEGLLCAFCLLASWEPADGLFVSFIRNTKYTLCT